MLEEQKIYENIAAAITNKPKLTLDIAVQQYTWLDKLLRRPRVRTFKLYPCLSGNMFRIAGIAAKLPAEISGENEESATLLLMGEHMSDVIYAVAALIQNDHKEPSKGLIKFIERNFDNNDLLACLVAGLTNANMQSFLSSIVLMRGSTMILNPQTNP